MVDSGRSGAVSMARRGSSSDAESRRSAGWAAAGLAALALAQPLFQQVSSNPAFLAEHGAGRTQVLLLAGALGVLAPALAAWAASRRSAWCRGLRWLVLGLPVAALARRLTAVLLPVAPQVALALASGVGAVWLFERRRGARTFFAALGLAAFVVPVVFLAAPSVRPYWWPAASDVEITDLGAATLPVEDLQVVFVVFDELPASVLYGTADGTLDGERYPAFAELARTSHEFRRAYSVAGGTDRAMPSLLTGRDPGARSRSLILAEYPDNLFTLAGQALRLDVGQDRGLLPRSAGTGDVEASGLGAMLTDLSLVYLHWLLPPQLRRGLPELHGGWTDLWSRRNRGPEVGEVGRAGDPADAGIDAEDADHGHFRIFADFVRDLQPATAPTLHYVHPLLPHQPWALLPSLQVYNDPWTKPSGVGAEGSGHLWGDHHWSVLQAYHRLMLQTAAVDRALDQLLRRLEQPGFAGRTLLVVTADHGIGFEPGGGKRGGDFEQLASEILWVPMLLRLPQQDEGVVHHGPVETVDLVPTVVRTLGFDPQRIRDLGLDGRDLLRDPPRAAEESLFVRLHGVEPGELEHLDDHAASTYDRRLGLFGAEAPGSDPSDQWWRVGPDEALRELLGRTVESLAPVQTEPAGAAVFERPRLYDRVEPASARVPSWFHAELRPDPESKTAPKPGDAVAVPVAIAVNGVVAAVSEARSEEDETRVSALLPPDTFRQGTNDIRLYAVRADGLHPIPRIDTEERLQRQVASGKRILAAEGPSMLQDLTMRPLGSVELTPAEDGVVIDSPALRPTVQLHLPGTARPRRMILQLEVTSPETTALGVRWQNPGEPGFRRDRKSVTDLLPGRQIVRVEVVRERASAPSEDSPQERLPPELASPGAAPGGAAEQWQLEIGQRPGRYVLHGIEVFEVEMP